ncbi:unnamed protein product [Rhodiola kirilowii]
MIKLRFVLRSWTTWSYRLLGKNDNHSYLVNFVQGVCYNLTCLSCSILQKVLETYKISSIYVHTRCMRSRRESGLWRTRCD